MAGALFAFLFLKRAFTPGFERFAENSTPGRWDEENRRIWNEEVW